MPKRTATLTREVRFSLRAPTPDIAGNSFAANPPVFGIEPFLILTVHLNGPIDERTGMLMNISEVDAVLRSTAIPQLRNFHARGTAGGTLWSNLITLRDNLGKQWPAMSVSQLDLKLTPFLRAAALGKEDRMVQVSQRFEFAASHRLYTPTLSPEQNLALFGRCTNANGHGHNYDVEVTVNVPAATKEAHVIAALQNVVSKIVIDRFDHKHLNLDCAEFATLNPTVENIAAVIFDLLANQFSGGLSLARVRVWETPKTSAEVTAETRQSDRNE